MATTLNQLTYDLLNKARGGITSDDDILGYRQVQFWIKNTRALLIRQDIEKGRTISGNILQHIPCLDVIIADTSTCPCQIPTGCSILRTERRIPKPLEINNRDLITRVSSIEIDARPFSFMSLARIPWTGNNKYAKKNPKAFYFDGYIWIINSSPIEKITVYGVFEDPTELGNYVACDGNPCYSDDDEYPISGWMIPMMQNLIVEKDLKVLLSTMPDMAGDAKADNEQSVQVNK
jgi:hypothetical protein